MEEINKLETELVSMMDNMLGCAVDLTQHNWDMLMRCREEFKSVLHDKLCKFQD